MAQCELFNTTTSNIPISTNIIAHCDTFLPEDFFSISNAISNFKKGQPFREPSGLINVGHNCYMNVVIQCLAFTPGFKNFCLTMPNAMYNANNDGPFFLDSFAHIFSLMNGSKSICPDWLITDSQYINPIYKPPYQQDAHEFLINLLDKFDQECRAALFNNNRDASKNIINQPSTMISNMFYGKISTKVRCKKCNYSNDEVSTFSDISIPIHTYNSVETAINKMLSFTSDEVDGKCEKCDQANCVIASKNIIQYPLILIVTLMRFDNQCRKIDDYLEYQKFITVGENKIKYQLYAMIIHEGRMINHGHFISYVMDSKETWYKVNDVCIFKVHEKKILELNPYVLFYKQCGI